jgi:hypothetical protein
MSALRILRPKSSKTLKMSQPSPVMSGQLILNSLTLAESSPGTCLHRFGKYGNPKVSQGGNKEEAIALRLNQKQESSL